jgi:hypothetical protein
MRVIDPDDESPKNLKLYFNPSLIPQSVTIWPEGTKKKVAPRKERPVLRSATTYSPTCAVPLAMAGLTSLFEMGRGGSPPL